jgi:putative transposase
MANYRRLHVPGGTVFLTLVTFERVPLFADPANVLRLRQAVATIKQELPFEFEAAVVLPDHVHFLWTLPQGDADYSKRVCRLKVEFTQSLRGVHALPTTVCASRRKHRESDVWQRRFLEHPIRDDDDFEQHVHYIHYNAVKHGLVACPHLWPYSSFRKWVARDAYSLDWACVCSGRPPPRMDWGPIEHWDELEPP